MNLTPESTAATLKAAIHESIIRSGWSNFPPGLVDDIHAAVHAALPPIVTQAVEQACTSPIHQAAILSAVMVPFLTTLEDEINDDHDKPSTDDAYRPGLRRAARLIRDTRRAATEEANQT